MKSICLPFILCFVAYSTFAQSPTSKDSMFVVATPTDLTAKGSVLVADSTGHAKWEQPGYVKTDSTFTISEDNKLVVENNAHVKGYLRLGKNSVYVGGFNKFDAPYSYENSEDIIFSDHSPTIINPSPRIYMWPDNKYNGKTRIDFPTQNTLINPEDGVVGLGTRTPDGATKLDVNGLLKTTSLKIPGGQEGKVLTSDNAGLARWENLANLSGNNYWSKNENSVTTTNAVGIGSTDTKGYKLAVNGKILSKGLKVQMEGWSDYVFDEKYKLATLEETERYILKNKHLKDVPSEKEVIANGIEVGEMNKILLQKIEELTLQVIHLNKKVNQLQSTALPISK